MLATAGMAASEGRAAAAAAGGAGGVSIGVLYKGMPPQLDGMNLMPDEPSHSGITTGVKGKLGAFGPGGDPARTFNPASGAGMDGTPGVDGVARAVMSAP